MKKRSFSLPIAIAIGLLVVSSVGVTAQGSDATAPVEFSVTWAFGPGVRSDTVEVGEGVVMTNGGAWQPGVISSASDPRLEGIVTIAANSHQYGGGPAIWNYAFRIENESGAWQQLPTITLETGDGDRNSTTGVLVGEGDYAGLVAVFDNIDEGGTYTLHGYILQGELPPDPEPFVGE